MELADCKYLIQNISEISLSILKIRFESRPKDRSAESTALSLLAMSTDNLSIPKLRDLKWLVSETYQGSSLVRLMLIFFNNLA